MIVFQQVSFLIVLVLGAYFFFRRVMRIRNNILMGQNEDRTDQPTKRLRSMLLIAFGQKKMFKKPIPALLHLMVYVGFLVINIEVLEFILDGISGNHRTFAGLLGNVRLTGVYTIALNIFEFLALAVIISCLFFLIRRNIYKVNRFGGLEMTNWPKLDANLILIFEIVLMFAILTMNAADQILQSRDVAGFPTTGFMGFSGFLVMPLFQSMDSGMLIAIERIAWWLHIIGIFAFAIYVTYSKHLHIFLAFPNTYYSNLMPVGKIKNMPEVTKEVNMMMGIPTEETDSPTEIKRLGAKDVRDLSWKNLMDAYTCTECGRCTAECPANQTGKKLSPRKIMMDTRDRVESLGDLFAKQGKEADDGKSLLGDFISKEEIFACTSCNACVEACPVMIDPLSIILQLRRYMSMEESSAPADWNAMFANMETSFSPWKFPPSDRFKWADDLNDQSGQKSPQNP